MLNTVRYIDKIIGDPAKSEVAAGENAISVP
jgi:hypothetical protein